MIQTEFWNRGANVGQGIPNLRQQESVCHLLFCVVLLIPIKELEVLQSFFAELFRLHLSVQSDSFIGLSVDRWRNVGEVCLMCLVNEKGFHLAEIITRVRRMSVAQPTPALMYTFI